MESNRQSLPIGYVLHGTNYGYEIQKILGQGTFGITYLAKVKMEGSLGALDSHVFVAIKEFFMKEINGRNGTSVTSGSKGGVFYDYRKKFKKEAENLSKLNHPNIVKVMESFETNNTIYYVMEYFSGGSLEQKLGNEGIPIKEAIDYTNQIGSAIAYMHEHKMLHLDLKPGNIVLDDKGNAVLIDFGLSKQYDENGQPESSTTVGGGTPGYAPLEQANYRDGKDFPVTMDIYALGATMFKMLTGTRAPEASAILNDGFPTYMLLSVCDSKFIVACIERAMSPKKKDRYQTVKELLGDVAKCSISQSSKNKETVCEVPVINDGGDWGYYKTIEGEAEYGTEKIVKHKVTAHIPIPKRIKVTRKIVNIKYYVELSKNEFDRGCLSILGYKGNKKKELAGGIPDDVVVYLKENGFFSPIHWERESSTCWPDDQNTVCIVFEYANRCEYSRKVTVANHYLLRHAVDDFLFNTSIGKEIAELLSMEDFEPDDILRREETIYGGPPVDEQEDNTGDKEKENENGCLANLLFLLAIGLHCIYPAIWCLTFLTNNYPYPNLWSVGIAWVVGLFLGIVTITKGRDRDRLIGAGLWALLVIETAIVYFVNYI